MVKIFRYRRQEHTGKGDYFLAPVRTEVEILLLFMYMESISLISPRLISTGLKSSAESSESVLACILHV